MILRAVREVAARTCTPVTAVGRVQARKAELVEQLRMGMLLAEGGVVGVRSSRDRIRRAAEVEDRVVARCEVTQGHQA